MLRKNGNRDDIITDSEKESLKKGERSTTNENMSVGKTSINSRKFKSGSRAVSRTPHVSLNAEPSSKHDRHNSSSGRDGISRSMPRNRHSNMSTNNNSFPESIMESLTASSTTNKVLITIIGFLLTIVMIQSNSSPKENEIFYGAPENFEPSYSTTNKINRDGFRDDLEPSIGTKNTMKRVGLRDEDILSQYKQTTLNREEETFSSMEVSESRKGEKSDSDKLSFDKGTIGLLEPPPSQEVASVSKSLSKNLDLSQHPFDPLSQGDSNMVDKEVKDNAPFSDMPPPIAASNVRGAITPAKPNSYDIEEISSAAYTDPAPKQQQQQQQQQTQSRIEAQNQSINQSSTASQTIAYVVSIYECPDTESKTDINSDHETGHDTALLDAAAVLKYAIHRASKHNKFANSKYDYQMIAIIHPEANQCYDKSLPLPSGEMHALTREDQLQSLGYKTFIRSIPVNVEDIQGEYLRTNINLSQKSGAKDLIRLQAYNLIEYPVVVLLDLRSLILKPLDDVIDIIIHGTDVNNGETIKNLDLAPNVKDNLMTKPLTNSIDAFFTRDYSSVSPQQWKYGIHPGLIIIRPSLETYKELEAIMREGDYKFKQGWGNSGIGNFFGAMTTKGLLAFYYDSYKKGETSVELNRCVYNSMADSPYIKVEGEVLCRNRGQLIDNNESTLSSEMVKNVAGNSQDCEDCRLRKMNDLKSINLSVCRDPWTCFHHLENMDQLRLCRNIHALWYGLRNELEQNWVKFGPWGHGSSYIPATKVEEGPRPEHFLGYCKSRGKEGYIPMVPPVMTKIKGRRMLR